jgi:hypothetical protein
VPAEAVAPARTAGWSGAVRAIEVDWLDASPIGPHAVALKRHLTERRYAVHAVVSYIAEVTHFARWVCTRRLALARIDEVSVAILLEDLLPSCACTGHARHDRADHSAASGHLLVVLCGQDVIAQPPVSTTPVDEELLRYDDHMSHVRGLAPKSRTMVLPIVGRLLAERFDGNVVDVKATSISRPSRPSTFGASLSSRPRCTASPPARGFECHRCAATFANALRWEIWSTG